GPKTRAQKHPLRPHHGGRVLLHVRHDVRRRTDLRLTM
ncbi:MAG: hypothetical protein AVDCRST_MAG53-2057, partial [uncultured Solirubrobacteraceae bacterium]